MAKRVVVVVVAVLGAAAFVACSGSDSSQFDNKNADPDAALESGSFVTDAADGGDASGPPQCDPVAPTSFTPTWIPPTKSAACTAADIQGYFDACLADPTKTAPCDAWVTAHAACATCIEPANHAGPIQWYDAGGVKRRYVTFNVAGCLALEQGATGPDSCGAAYSAAVQCTRQACERCFVTGGTQEQFLACEQPASNLDPCKGYKSARAQKCAGITDAGASTLTCFRGTGESNQSFFTRLIGVTCGQ